MHGLLVRGGVHFGGVPHPFHVFAAVPFGALATQADDGFALVTDQVVSGDAHRPAQARGLRHDLVGGVNGFGAADFRNRRHLIHRLKQLHAEGDGTQFEHAFELGRQLGKVGRGK